MSEQLAIMPPSEKPPESRPRDDDEVLVGNIVSPDHAGLRDAVDAGTASETEPTVISGSIESETDQPDKITVVDAGTDDRGKTRPYARTYTKGEDGQYSETERRKVRLNTDGDLSQPVAEDEIRTNRDASGQEYFNGQEPDFNHKSWGMEAESKSPYEEQDDEAEAARRQEWQRIMDREAESKAQANRERERLANQAGNILRDFATLSESDRRSMFEAVPDSLARAMDEAMQRGVSRLEARMASPNPGERAEGFNTWRDLYDLMRSSLVHNGEFAAEPTAEEKLDRYVFAPTGAESLFLDLGAELATDEIDKTPEDELMTDDEKQIAKMVLDFGLSVAAEARDQDKLIEAGAVLGESAESAFIDSHLDGYDSEPVKEEQRSKMKAAFRKLRQKAIRHLKIKVPSGSAKQKQPVG